MIPQTAVTTAEIPVAAALRSSKTNVFKVRATILLLEARTPKQKAAKWFAGPRGIYASNRESAQLARLKLKQ